MSNTNLNHRAQISHTNLTMPKYFVDLSRNTHQSCKKIDWKIAECIYYTVLAILDFGRTAKTATTNNTRQHRGTGIKNCSYPCPRSMPNTNRSLISEALVQRKSSVRTPSRAATSSR
jgi:hypothetical protein